MLPKVTAIGEILYDVYPDQKRLGGAPFNFIYHVWKILGAANFISSVGNDENGRELLEHLSSIGFNIKSIAIDNEHPTGTVLVRIDENKIPHFTLTPECSFDYLFLNEDIKKIFEEETDLLYFGTFTTRTNISRGTVLSLLNKPSKKYFCDLNLRHDLYTKELLETALSSCNVIKANDFELGRLQKFFDLDESYDAAVEQLIDKFDIDLFGLTLGENGARLYSRNETDIYHNNLTQIVDSLGAGDAFSALLCIGYLKELPLKEINRLASEFAQEICMVSGALPAEDSIYTKYQSIFRDK